MDFLGKISLSTVLILKGFLKKAFKAVLRMHKSSLTMHSYSVILLLSLIFYFLYSRLFSPIFFTEGQVMKSQRTYSTEVSLKHSLFSEEIFFNVYFAHLHKTRRQIFLQKKIDCMYPQLPLFNQNKQKHFPQNTRQRVQCIICGFPNQEKVIHALVHTVPSPN